MKVEYEVVKQLLHFKEEGTTMTQRPEEIPYFRVGSPAFLVTLPSVQATPEAEHGHRYVGYEKKK